MPQSSAYRGVRARGFTLIELLVTIAVLAVIVAIAAPSFTSVINGNRLTSQANELLASLQLARNEALRRNATAVVCRTDDGQSCSAGGAWRGWITFVDTDGNRAPAADEIVRTSSTSNVIDIKAGGDIKAARVVFRSDGLARTTDSAGNPGQQLLNADLLVCMETERPAENQRYVEIRSGSRMSVTSRDGAGSCLAPGAGP